MGRGRRWTVCAMAGIAAIGGGGALAGGATAGSDPSAHRAAAQQCAGDRAPHNPANPLDLPQPPGANPLRGARFFVAGPAAGSAAGVIAHLLGVNPAHYSYRYSWSRFAGDLRHGSFARRLARNHGLAYQVRELSKSASQPDVIRVSSYAYGGTPTGTAAEANKIFCSVLAGDPGAVPIINTYYIHPLLGSVTDRAGMGRIAPRFRAFVDELAAATGNHRAVFLLELDALGASSRWFRAGTSDIYESLLRYEVQRIAALPHTVVYLEAGYSDSNRPGPTARALRAIGLGQIPNFRGFYTNDTHTNWTVDEDRWAERISRALGGVHYIVSTAMNGRGPLHNPHPVSQGTNNNCNPPNRGLGPRLTVSPGGPAPHADAYMWAVVPGFTSGRCGGGPSSGFWVAKAVSLGRFANGQLGPHYPSRPY